MQAYAQLEVVELTRPKPPVRYKRRNMVSGDAQTAKQEEPSTSSSKLHAIDETKSLQHMGNEPIYQNQLACEDKKSVVTTGVKMKSLCSTASASLRVQQKLKIYTACTSFTLIGSFTHIGFLISEIVKFITMPHSFAWRSLLLSFGSMYYSASDTATFPVLPVIQISISAIMVLCSVGCLITSKESFALALKIGGWLQFIFITPTIPLFYALWSYKKSILRETMKKYMNLNSVPFASDYYPWNTTQSTLRCCGIDGPSDWYVHYKEPLVPISCHTPLDTNKTDDKIRIWSQGCYAIEYEKMNEFGMDLIFCLFAGAILSGILMFVLNLRSQFLFQNSLLKSPAPENRTFTFKNETSTVFVNCDSKGATLNMDGVFVETKGAFGPNISMNETQAIIPIQYFKVNLETIKIECDKQNNRITASVRGQNVLRGTMTITPKTDMILDQIKVEDDKINGILIIKVAPALPGSSTEP